MAVTGGAASGVAAAGEAAWGVLVANGVEVLGPQPVIDMAKSDAAKQINENVRMFDNLVKGIEQRGSQRFIGKTVGYQSLAEFARNERRYKTLRIGEDLSESLFLLFDKLETLENNSVPSPIGGALTPFQ
jgi:hypothetical protein